MKSAVGQWIRSVFAGKSADLAPLQKATAEEAIALVDEHRAAQLTAEEPPSESAPATPPVEPPAVEDAPPAEEGPAAADLGVQAERARAGEILAKCKIVGLDAEFAGTLIQSDLSLTSCLSAIIAKSAEVNPPLASIKGRPATAPEAVESGLVAAAKALAESRG